MNEQIPKFQIESPESIERGKIDLTGLTFNFIPDVEIERYYREKFEDYADRDEWVKRNTSAYARNRAQILRWVENGILSDDRPETWWKFRFDRVRSAQEKVSMVKRDLENGVQNIKKSAAERLGIYLPDWTIQDADIVFEMIENATFIKYDKRSIKADLGRLALERYPIEKTIGSVAHEVFHIWMQERSSRGDVEQDQAADEILRERIVFKTIDEGLAVLISGGRTLKEHHEELGRNYNSYVQESFQAFRSFLATESREYLEEGYTEEFTNKGHFYVVGNEIVQTILRQYGLAKFRRFIEEQRDDSTKALEIYRRICAVHAELPKI